MEGEEKKRGTSKQTLAFILPQRNRKEKKNKTGVMFLDAIISFIICAPV